MGFIKKLLYVIFGRTAETYRIKTKNYELKGSFADKHGSLLLRDLIFRECITRGYSGSVDEDFIIPYDISQEDRHGA